MQSPPKHTARPHDTLDSAGNRETADTELGLDEESLADQIPVSGDLGAGSVTNVPAHDTIRMQSDPDTTPTQSLRPPTWDPSVDEDQFAEFTQGDLSDVQADAIDKAGLPPPLVADYTAADFDNGIQQSSPNPEDAGDAVRHIDELRHDVREQLTDLGVVAEPSQVNGNVFPDLQDHGETQATPEHEHRHAQIARALAILNEKRHLLSGRLAAQRRNPSGDPSYASVIAELDAGIQHIDSLIRQTSDLARELNIRQREHMQSAVQTRTIPAPYDSGTTVHRPAEEGNTSGETLAEVYENIDTLLTLLCNEGILSREQFDG